ncbi:MAG: hypothetical protein CW338_06570 [Clostridiales bacterium]|nr:hypothetical protein [Clostridiales bacterium]
MNLLKIDPIVMMELTCAIFVVLLSFSQNNRKDRSRGTVRLRVLCMVTFLSLVSDSMAYIFDHPETNHYLEHWSLYFVNLLPFIMSNFILICYSLYCESYLEKKTKLRKWVFRVPVLILSADIVFDIIWFALGNLVTYENGYYIAGELPLPLMLSYYALLFYVPVVAFIRRKDVGIRTVMLFVSYIIPVVAAILILEILEMDYTLVAGAVSATYIALILQRDTYRAAIKNEAAHAALAENNARVLALEDNFESLYDVDLDTDDYDLYIKDQAEYNDVNEKLTKESGFFSDTLMNAERVVCSEDMAELRRVINKEYILSALAQNDHFDWWYRLMIKDAPVWFRMRIVYKNAEKRHIIVGIFNAEEEMEARLNEQRSREMLIDRMMGDDALYLVDFADDTMQVLHDHNAEVYQYDVSAGYAATAGHFIDTYVAEPDRESMRLAVSAEHMREQLEKESEYSVLYRDTVTGENVYYRMSVVKYSDTKALQSFMKCNEEVLTALANEKLTGQYDAIYVADLERNTVHAVRASRVLEEGVITDGVTYGELVRRLAKKVMPKYKREWLNYSDPDYVKKAMSAEDHREFVYELPGAGDSMRRAVIDVIERRNGAASLVLLSFMPIDDARARELVLQRKMADQKIWLDFFVKSYSSAYTVDLTNDTFEVLNMQPSIAPYFTPGGTKADMERFIDEHIHPDDRELMRRSTDKEFLIKQLH